jgi:L-threonylcarbamoyladenylate synthase
MTTQIGTDLATAQRLLTAGQLVAIPTETVYGLAANALDAAAVTQIFQTKNRPAFDPLIVHSDSLARMEPFLGQIPDAARQLAEAFWPGPLTLLLPKQSAIADLVTSGLPTVGVRVPNHPMTLELLQTLPFPVAAPSANPFGYISPTTAQHVADQLGGQIPYILDGGPCAVGVESTIISFDEERPTILRLGGIGVEQIEAVIGPVSVRNHSTDNPAAPGMLTHHYAPRKPLVLVANRQISDGSRLSQLAFSGAGALVFQELLIEIPDQNQVILSPGGNLAEAAHNLFAHLRVLDELPIDIIYAELLPEVGLGRAINDRLRRAAAR